MAATTMMTSKATQRVRQNSQNQPNNRGTRLLLFSFSIFYIPAIAIKAAAAATIQDPQIFRLRRQANQHDQEQEQQIQLLPGLPVITESILSNDKRTQSHHEHPCSGNQSTSGRHAKNYDNDETKTEQTSSFKYLLDGGPTGITLRASSSSLSLDYQKIVDRSNTLFRAAIQVSCSEPISSPRTSRPTLSTLVTVQPSLSPTNLAVKINSRNETYSPSSVAGPTQSPSIRSTPWPSQSSSTTQSSRVNGRVTTTPSSISFSTASPSLSSRHGDTTAISPTVLPTISAPTTTTTKPSSSPITHQPTKTSKNPYTSSTNDPTSVKSPTAMPQGVKTTKPTAYQNTPSITPTQSPTTLLSKSIYNDPPPYLAKQVLQQQGKTSISSCPGYTNMERLQSIYQIIIHSVYLPTLELIMSYSPTSHQQQQQLIPFYNETSPYYQALYWLVVYDESTCPAKTSTTKTSIIQRYVLALIYYSMNGPNWFYCAAPSLSVSAASSSSFHGNSTSNGAHDAIFQVNRTLLMSKITTTTSNVTTDQNDNQMTTIINNIDDDGANEKHIYYSDINPAYEKANNVEICRTSNGWKSTRLLSTSTNECHWFGITCNNKNQIIHINFSKYKKCRVVFCGGADLIVYFSYSY